MDVSKVCSDCDGTGRSSSCTADARDDARDRELEGRGSAERLDMLRCRPVRDQARVFDVNKALPWETPCVTYESVHMCLLVSY